MIKTNISQNLLEELKVKVKSNSELVNKLSDMLCLGKEAIYRRMRGEVPFSLEESSVIAYHMGLSLDSLGGMSMLKRPFVFKIANFAQPSETDCKLINEFVEYLDYIKDMSGTEMGVSAKLIPDALHLAYPHITRFYLFKWIYQYDNNYPIKRYENVAGSQKLLGILNNMKNFIRQIKYTYYIFDKKIVENLVEDINYFKIIELISEKDIQLMKQDLFACLDYIELLARQGVNEEGNKVEIYLSNLNFEAGFSYVRSDGYKLSSIRSFTMYDISSSDTTAFEYSMKWMQSLKRASSLISQSAEIERKKFFNRQREIIANL